MAKQVEKYYILGRSNPQLSKPYYQAVGLCTESRVNKMINGTLYGSRSIYGSFESEDGYLNAIQQLRNEGNQVY